MNRLEWVNAGSVEEVVARAPGAVIKAGGVDVMDLLKEGLIAPERLVNLRTVPGLDRLGEGPSGLVIGPLVTLARLAEDPLVRGRYHALAEACGRAATPQIRNMATLGGNLLQRPRCWYFRSEAFPCRKKGGDTCFAQQGDNQFHALFDNSLCAAIHASSAACALVALGASVELAGPGGRRELPLEALLTPADRGVTRENALGPAEVITALHVPPPAAGAASAYAKIAEKESFDWPLVEVAVSLELSGGVCRRASVVLGAVAHAPRRATGAEQALAGRPIDPARARDAAARAVMGATPMRDNGHKVALLEVAVRRAILAAAGQGGAP